MNHEEEAIIKEAQRGNLLAFERLIQRYDRQVLQLAMTLVRDAQDAEDVYQEVFVRVYKNLSKFRFKSEFSTWLYRVVVNYCINHQKKQARRRTMSLERNGRRDETDGLQEKLPDDELDPENRLLNQELSDEIDLAIEQLPAKQRTVFILRHFHGYKLKDIAETMGCTIGTVKNYLFRATHRMQTLLQDYKTP